MLHEGYFLAQRIVGLGVFGILSTLYSLQVYWDRKELLEMWQKRDLNTHRVFRITGFVSSICMTVACVDFYGVYGDLPFGMRVTMLSIPIVLVWLNMGMVFYHSLIASCAFLPSGYQTKKRHLKLAFWVHSSNVVITTTVSFVVESRALFLYQRAIEVLNQMLTVVIVNGVYRALRNHQRIMEESGTKFTPRKDRDAWSSIIGKWKKYVVIVSGLMFSAFASICVEVLLDVLQQLDNLTVRNDVVSLPEGHTFPRIHAVTLPLVLLGLLVVLLWRSWRTEEGTRSNPNTATGRSTKRHENTAFSTTSNDMRGVSSRRTVESAINLDVGPGADTNVPNTTSDVPDATHSVHDANSDMRCTTADDVALIDTISVREATVAAVIV